MIDEDKIIAYILDELDETERQEVAAALEKDEQLRQTAEHYQKIKRSLRAKRVENLSEQIAAYETTLSASANHPPDQQSSKSKKNGRRYGLFGLFFLIGLLFSICFFYGKSHYSNTALAQKYFLLPADPSVAGNQEASIFSSAVEAFFSEKDYPKAAALFTSIPAASDYAQPARYFAAHAQFLQGDYDQALTDFTALSNQKREYPPDQQQRIEWNEMISRLATGAPVASLPESWLSTPTGQALDRDLRSVWRKFLH